MYRILIYHNGEFEDELDKTATIDEAKEKGKAKVDELGNDYMYKIKAD